MWACVGVLDRLHLFDIHEWPERCWEYQNRSAISYSRRWWIFFSLLFMYFIRAALVCVHKYVWCSSNTNNWRGMSALIFPKHSVAAATISNEICGAMSALRCRSLRNVNNVAHDPTAICRILYVRCIEVRFDRQTIQLSGENNVERFESYTVFRHTCVIKHMTNKCL